MKRMTCAIYTRKSSDEGLEKAFNSLDAQREACAAFVISQKHAGWVALPDHYDDGGLSGGTLERPALQRLLADIKAGKVQIVVVYKVDRLTRSLADFAKIVDVFDAHGASFVSVTQQFNTTTSMGRLTLNMLLSFAQFEREIAGERIRDKIAASKAKGMWMGGNVPLGYDVKDRKLMVNEREAATVRTIFSRYAELGSVRLLKTDLERLGVMSKRRDGAGGRLAGGNPLSRGALYTLLQNRLYRGEIEHKGQVYPGQHPAIVDAALWTVVQQKLAANRRNERLRTSAQEPSLLAGLLVDDEGQRMTPTHAVRRGRRYRYYVSGPLIRAERCDHRRGWRVPAGDLEGLVLDRLHSFLACELPVADVLARSDLNASTQRSVLSKAQQLAEGWADLPTSQKRSVVQLTVEQIRVSDDNVRILLKPDGVLRALSTELDVTGRESALQPIELSIDAKLRRAGKGIRLVIGGAAGKPDDRLVALLRDSYAARDALLTGRDATIEAMACRLGVKRDHLSTLVRVSYLAPDLVSAISTGAQPVGLTVSRLLQVCKELPCDWHLQCAVLGFVNAQQ